MVGKNTLTRIVIVTAVVAVVSLGIAALIAFLDGGFDQGQAGRMGRSVDERKTLPLDAIELLSISSVREDVQVVEGSSADVEAWLHGTVGAGGRDDAPRLSVARNGSTAEIALQRERRFGLGPFWNNLVLEVRVPKGYANRLSVKTVSGSIDVAGHLYGGVSLIATSGELRVGPVKTAELDMHTTSGSIRIEEAAAQKATISSVSGNVDAGPLSGDTTLHTTSGNVRAAFSAMPARIDASTNSGTLTLRLPAAAGFSLDARSTSGDISCKFPITIAESQTGGARHALHGVVQAGSNTVLAHTVSGNIRIER